MKYILIIIFMTLSLNAYALDLNVERLADAIYLAEGGRSEERRVGKECRL